MHIEYIIDSLPNGFHDSKVASIEINYSNRSICFSLSVWIGDMEKTGEEREKYKKGILFFKDFDFCIFDDPDPSYPYESEYLDIDIGLGPLLDSPKIIPPVKDGNFLVWIWVNEWNGYIRISARDAEFNWV